MMKELKCYTFKKFADKFWDGELTPDAYHDYLYFLIGYLGLSSIEEVREIITKKGSKIMMKESKRYTFKKFADKFWDGELTPDAYHDYLYFLIGYLGLSSIEEVKEILQND